MPLQGSAFLALWNDFDAARDAEYNCWHTFEHVPERVGINGILSGRRYFARERGDDRYFTLYELDAMAALAGTEYADVVDRPTSWTLGMRSGFRNFQRYPCTTLLSLGAGIGGAIATSRFGLHNALSEQDTEALRRALAPFVESADITSIHFGRAESDASFAIKNAAITEGSTALAQYVLLVEGPDRSGLKAAGPQVDAAMSRSVGSIQTMQWKTFDLAFVIARRDLQHSTRRRQPARVDLQARYGGEK